MFILIVKLTANFAKLFIAQIIDDINLFQKIKYLKNI